MAASVTPSDFAVYVAPPATAPNSRFLDRCVEDLSPGKITDCEKRVRQWNAISVISVVAFFALAIGGFVAASILAPVWVPPVVAIGSLLLAMPATQQIIKFQEWALAAKEEAEKYKEVQRNYAELRLEALQNGNSDQHLPLLAQSKYFEKKANYWNDIKNIWVENESKISSSPAADKERNLAHNFSLESEYKAINCKMQNAFINAVLRNPEFIGTFETLGILSKLERKREFAGPEKVISPEVIFTFKNRNIAPISYEDAKTQSVAELGQRIFAAMAA